MPASATLSQVWLPLPQVLGVQPLSTTVSYQAASVSVSRPRGLRAMVLQVRTVLVDADLQPGQRCALAAAGYAAQSAPSPASCHIWHTGSAMISIALHVAGAQIFGVQQRHCDFQSGLSRLQRMSSMTLMPWNPASPRTMYMMDL